MEATMSDKVYKLIEITGTSSVGIEDAIQNAIAKSAKSVRNMRWFQVVETRGAVDGNLVSQWQVTLKIGFSLED
jgi:flavin-binding protein dodecin